MWGAPLDTCMLDTRFREKYLDALTTVIGDEERAGLDILTHGDLHCDDDMAGRSWHHYPLQRAREAERAYKTRSSFWSRRTRRNEIPAPTGGTTLSCVEC